MPGSNSAFIPTINAITTSQDLQWMVQPTVITSMSSPYSRSHPYGHHLTNGPGILGHNPLARPGVIRSIGDTRGRRKRDEQVRPLRRRFCCAKDYKVILYQRCMFYPSCDPERNKAFKEIKEIKDLPFSFALHHHLPVYLTHVLSQLTPEEEEKRRVRRERNKLAAAKCRNRRRELTEMLQGVSRKASKRDPVKRIHQNYDHFIGIYHTQS